MVSCLLASHGFVYLEAPFVVQLLPAMLAAARGAVPTASRSTTYGNIRPPLGKIPAHGSDARLLSPGRSVRARSIILVKDVNGMHEADPRTHSGAKLIEEKKISGSNLLARNLPTLPVEPMVRTQAKLVKSIRIINGLERGNLTAALEGREVGTENHA